MSSWCFLSLQLFLPSPPAAIPQGLWGAEGVSSSWASQPFFHLFPRIGETYFYLKGWSLASCMNTGNKLLPLPQQHQLPLWIITWLSKECCWLVAEMSVLYACCFVLMLGGVFFLFCPFVCILFFALSHWRWLWFSVPAICFLLCRELDATLPLISSGRLN